MFLISMHSHSKMQTQLNLLTNLTNRNLAISSGKESFLKEQNYAWNLMISKKYTASKKDLLRLALSIKLAMVPQEHSLAQWIVTFVHLQSLKGSAHPLKEYASILPPSHFFQQKLAEWFLSLTLSSLLRKYKEK